MTAQSTAPDGAPEKAIMQPSSTWPQPSVASEGLRPMGVASIWAVVLLTLGATMALIVPMTYSLSVRLATLAPGHEELLGYVVGIGAAANVITTPLLGVMGDRTRSRFGRRRAWALGGMGIGLFGLVAIATAHNVAVVFVAWIVTLVAWQTAGNQATYVQGERLPAEQRARVASLTGFAGLVSPVLGMAIVTPFASHSLLLFLIPGVVGALGVLFFTLAIREEPPPRQPTPFSMRETIAQFGFSPTQYPDYAWTWLGRFILFFGIALVTTYTTYFLASRLGMAVSEIAGVATIAGLGGVAASALGVFAAGFLSDRLKRRRIFVLIAGFLGFAGTALSATSYSLSGLLGGFVILMLAVGVFSTAGQAIFLDVLPDRSQAGRYVSIMNLAQQAPAAIGPLFAPSILGIGVASSGNLNYTLLFVFAGTCFFVGALTIAVKVRGVP